MPSRPPHKRLGILAGVALVAIVVSFLIVAVTTKQRRQAFQQTVVEQKETDRLICERINNVYRAIQVTIRASIQNTPKIAYYKGHPVELAKAIDNLERQLEVFEPKDCKVVR